MTSVDLFIAVYLFVIIGIMGIFCVIAYFRRKKRGDFTKNEKGQIVLTKEAELSDFGETPK